MARLLLGLGLCGALARGVELTPANWDDETAGKTVFVKFLAPWCGHCKSMKPDWDKLMKQWNTGENAKTSLIADVDCTGEEAKALCEQHGIEGFPTIKWGDPSGLEDYEGGRGYEQLHAFAKENLKPMCGVANIDLCDGEKKAKIAELQAMSAGDLAKQIEAKDEEIKAAEVEFEAEVEKLQEKYNELEKNKQAKVQAVKESGLKLMKAVAAAAKKEAKLEL